MYERLARDLPEPERVFLNFGAVGDSEDLHRNLVEFTLGDFSIAGRRVLDVGCGRGGSSRHLGLLGADVIGVDLCLAHGAWQRHTNPGRFAVGDAQSLAVADATVDVVFNLESAHCYGDFEGFLDEVRRVLRPGGALCFADLWEVDALGLDWASRERALQNCGLQVERDVDLSEAVRAALAHPDGVVDGLESARTATNARAIRALQADHRALRLHLAARQCRYRALRLRA